MPSVSSINIFAGDTKDTTACAPDRDAFETAVAKARVNKIAAGLAKSVGGSLIEAFLGPQLTSALKTNFADTIGNIHAAIDDDTENLRLVASSLDTVYDCRRKLSRTLSKDVGAGKMARADAEAQVTLMRTVMREDTEAAGKVLGEVQKRTDDLRVATQKAKAEATTSEQKKQVQETEKALQSNQNAHSDAKKKVHVVATRQEGTITLGALFQWIRSIIPV